MDSTTDTNDFAQTGQFHPDNVKKASAGGACGQLGDTLYYMVPDKNRVLRAVKCNITELITQDNVQGMTSSSNWSHTPLSTNIENGNSATFKTADDSSPGAAVVNDKMYFFWMDRSNDYSLYATWVDSTGQYATAAFKCTDFNGRVITECSSVTVNNYNDKLLVQYFDGHYQKLKTQIFDVNNINNDDNEWQGVDAGTINPAEGGAVLSAAYWRISSAWFSQGSGGNFMVTSFFSANSNKAQFIVYGIDEKGFVEQSSQKIFSIEKLDCYNGFNLVREPSGRILALTCATNNSEIESLRLNTKIDLSGFSSQTTLKWETSELLNGVKEVSKKNPIPFIVFSNKVDKGEVKLKDADGQMEPITCLEAKTFLFAFYCHGNSSDNGYDIQCQISEWGTSRTVPDYRELKPKGEDKDKYILGAIMDSFPFPNQNIGSLEPGAAPMSYTYGTSSETINDSTVEWTAELGIRAEFAVTKGIGPALSFQFKGGPQGSEVKTTTIRESRGLVQDTAIVMGDGGNQISPKGQLHGHTLYSVRETIAIWYDQSGKLINGNDAPLFSTVVPFAADSSYRTGGSYDIYSAEPGDIRSYEKERINARMASHYEKLTPEQKEYFVPWYATNYIVDVIEKRAQKMANGKNFLEFVVFPSGGSHPEFEHIDKEMETSGYLLNGSIYAGVGFGQELSIFGPGKQFSGSAMVGFEFSRSVKEGVGTSHAWGVTANFNYPDHVPDSYQYNARLYLCPADNMWAREVEFMAENVADKNIIQFDNSKPMRAIFVVMGIKLNPPAPQDQDGSGEQGD